MSCSQPVHLINKQFMTLYIYIIDMLMRTELDNNSLEIISIKLHNLLHMPLE